MRPFDPRVRGLMALGALVLTYPLAVATAHADTRTISIHARHTNVVAGSRAYVSGTVHGVGAGRTVALQRRGAHGWTTVARDGTSAGGGFHLRYRTRRPGTGLLRLRVTATAHASSADAASASATRALGRLNVYRHAFVSWYGPGLYGRHLGCGGTLTPGTLGVANRTLPCGTRLTLRYRGRSVRVRVVDRGPYVGGREFDLTAATRARLQFPSTGTLLVTR